MGDYIAFFYGTLMARPVLYRVCYGTTNPDPWQRDLLNVRPAVLHGYTRHKVSGADYPGIIPVDNSSPESASSVRGTVVTGLTDQDIRRLDIFEGSEYGRESVEVFPLEVVGEETGKGNVEASEPVQAQTYIWTAGKDQLEPVEWDFGDFVKTKMARWAGNDEEYKEVDQAIAAEAGTDPTRGRGLNGAITSQLRDHESGREAR